MKEYPAILAAGHLLAQSAADYLGRPFVAFDKLDGSNIRAEWDRQRGWHLFGSRRRLLDATQPLLGQAIQLILDNYGDWQSSSATARRSAGSARPPPTLSSSARTVSPANTIRNFCGSRRTSRTRPS